MVSNERCRARINRHEQEKPIDYDDEHRPAKAELSTSTGKET